MARADRLMAESCRASRKKLLRRHLAQRRNLYAKAVAQGDVKTALAVLRDEAELLNLYPPKRSEISGPDGGLIQAAQVELSDDERRVAIEAILSRMGQAGPGQADSGQAQLPGYTLGQAGTPDGESGTDPGPLATAIAPLFQ